MPEWLTIVATVSLALAVLCWLGLPMTIGLMAVSLTFSLLVLALGKAGFSIETEAEQFVQKIDFNEAVLHGLLAFFLFAGALRVKLDECSRWVVATFAFMGTVLSAALIGLISYAVFTLYMVESWHCLLFGALIAPTDPKVALSSPVDCSAFTNMRWTIVSLRDKLRATSAL